MGNAYLLREGRAFVNLAGIFLPLPFEVIRSVSMPLAMQVNMISLRLQASPEKYKRRIQHAHSHRKNSKLRQHVKP
jgi:hypothetical protein